jgi:hypothetical protein
LADGWWSLASRSVSLGAGNHLQQANVPINVLIRIVIPTRERSEAGEPALSEVEGNLLFHRGIQDSMPNSSLVETGLAASLPGLFPQAVQSCRHVFRNDAL